MEKKEVRRGLLLPYTYLVGRMERKSGNIEIIIIIITQCKEGGEERSRWVKFRASLPFPFSPQFKET